MKRLADHWSQFLDRPSWLVENLPLPPRTKLDRFRRVSPVEIRHRGKILSGDERSDLFAQHHTLEVMRLEHVEDDDRHFVVHAQRKRSRVHHAELLYQRLAVGDLFVSFRL